MVVKNKRGIVLILSFMVIVVLLILTTAIVSRNISESNISKRFIGSIKAFWAAEAGVAAAIAALPETDDLSDIIGNASTYYNTAVTSVEGFSNRWTITSIGSYVLSRDSEGEVLEQIQRTIIAVVEKSLGEGGGNPSLLNYAIETTGNLEIKGNITINPEGSQYANSELAFETVFGMTKDELKALVETGHSITDPSTDWQPEDGMSGITWVDVTESNKYHVSSEWSGSGLLIVNGNGEDIALDISGPWTFSGVIWVFGKISISGEATLNGAIFAEIFEDLTDKLTGHATLNFNEDYKDSAFSFITQGTGTGATRIISWQETQNPYPLE